MKTKSVLLFLSFTLACAVSSCAISSEQGSVDIQQETKREIVLVYSNGEQVLAQMTGDADPVTSQFAVYSLAKPMTVAAALRLAEIGKLLPSSDIREFLPEFPVRDNPVTPLHLATHQSGIRHYSKGEATSECDTLENALSRFRADELVASPGSGTHYSSHGFVALSAVVAQAYEADFDTAMKGLLFEPMNMTPTLVTVPMPNAPGLTCKFGAGGYLASADDIARFALGLFDTEFLSVRSRQMFLRGSETFKASGVGDAATAHLWVHPKSRSAVIILSDASSPEARAAMMETFETQVQKLRSKN